MSRKFGLLFVAVYIFLFVLYLGYDAHVFKNTSDIFFYGYFNNPQRYLFLFSFFITPILFFQHIPFFKAEYITRLNDNVLNFIFKEIIKISFSTGIYIYCTFNISALLWGINVTGINHIYLFFRLFTFLLSCTVLYYTLYTMTEKHFLSVMLVLISNVIYLSIIISVQFFIFFNQLTDVTIDLFFVGYLLLICVWGISYLLFFVKRKECYT